MASNTRPGTLTSLSKRFHYTPSSALSGSSANANSPKLILLFGWMGAPLKHVQKYVDGYATIWPSSPIIVVQSLAPDWRPLSKFGKDYTTLVNLLKQHEVDITGADNGVLMSVMSNGGCWSATALLRNLPPNSILRPRALIFDSCPGVGRFSVTMRAFLIAGRYRLLRKVAAIIVITIYYFLSKLVNTIAGISPVKELRDGVIRRIATRTRTYIYSDSDDIILSVDVEAHAKQSANEKPQEKVILEKFNGSAHVGHMRADPDRYWRAVRQAWDPAEKSYASSDSFIEISQDDVKESYNDAKEMSSLPSSETQLKEGTAHAPTSSDSPPLVNLEETLPPLLPGSSLSREDTVSSTTSSFTASPPITKKLFGGAMLTTIPSSFQDASAIRQVPDNQEVFLDSGSDETSLIIELTERVDAKNDEDALREHFEALCADNESKVSKIISLLPIESQSTLGPSFILIGLQTPQKFHENGSEIMVIVGLIRLESVKADLLVSMNLPCADPVVAKDSQPHRRSRNLNVRRTHDFAKTAVETAIADFQVLDWSLFP